MRRGGISALTQMKAHRISGPSEVVSCGGVVFRRDAQGRIEVLLVGRQRPVVWTLPKGTPHPGETPEQTAIREVAEETGIRGRVIAPLCSITYSFTTPRRPSRRRSQRSSFSQVVHKTVHHYLIAPVGGDPRFHDAEYDMVEWVPAECALERLTYENEREVVRRALQVLDACQPAAGHWYSASKDEQ